MNERGREGGREGRWEGREREREKKRERERKRERKIERNRERMNTDTANFESGGPLTRASQIGKEHLFASSRELAGRFFLTQLYGNCLEYGFPPPPMRDGNDPRGYCPKSLEVILIFYYYYFFSRTNDRQHQNFRVCQKSKVLTGGSP
jgi:hypothetical protein